MSVQDWLATKLSNFHSFWNNQKQKQLEIAQQLDKLIKCYSRNMPPRTMKLDNPISNNEIGY